METLLQLESLSIHAFTQQILGLFFFLAVLGLHCCSWAFSSCSEWGLLSSLVRGLPVAVTSLVVEHRLSSTGSVVLAHGLSCFTACGIFPDQESNPCPHW